MHPKPSLVETIISKGATSDSSRDFKYYVTSDNSGLYYTEDASTYGENGQKIYYYAGTYDDVDNWVIFAGYCWRIIRTTSTGGTKLIYSGSPTGNSCVANTQNSGNLNIGMSKFNDANNNPQYVLWQGLQTDSSISSDNWSTSQLNTMIQSTTGNDSTVKENIKTWYVTNIIDKGYEKKLENMNLCFNFKGATSYNATTYSDLTVVELGEYDFEEHLRSNSGQHPSYNCSDGITIPSKYGLISINEANYGGVVGSYYYYSRTAWLVDTKIQYWTASPCFMESNFGTFTLAQIGTFGSFGFRSGSSEGVRPLISLASKASVRSGDGTIETPFVI